MQGFFFAALWSIDFFFLLLTFYAFLISGTLLILQAQAAESKITHVIQLKHTLDLVPQLRVCTCWSSFNKHSYADF